MARHAISVLKTANGDTARRTVVAADKCAGCHEWFEGHGGNRVYETQVCVMCHVPGLATSGRGIVRCDAGGLQRQHSGPTPPTASTGAFTLDDKKILTEWGFNPAQPNAALKFPVASNNFKDMIHGIHAGRERVTPFQDARDRSARRNHAARLPAHGLPGQVEQLRNLPRDGRFVRPEDLQLRAGQYPGVDVRVDRCRLRCRSPVQRRPRQWRRPRSTRPTTTDTVTTPFAAACVSCHDNTPAKAHIAISGGAVNLTRAAAQPTPRPLEDVESCAVCHGPGRDFDTEKVHQ